MPTACQFLKMNNLFNSAKYFYLFYLVIFTIVSVFLVHMGKENAFLVINSHYNSFFDTLFFYITELGNTWTFIVLIILMLFFKIRYSIIFVYALLINTIFVQGMKHLVYPEALRPIKYFEGNYLPHYLEATDIHAYNSFPSGHTATAFAIAVLLAYVFRHTGFHFLIFLLAFLVGYSRVYLAQHFAGDVLAGSFIGILSGSLAIACFDKPESHLYSKLWLGKSLQELRK